MRTEGIITQLVFNHALRIRMKAELPESTGTESRASSTAAPSPDNASISEQPIAAEASESSNGSGDETLAHSSSASIKSGTESKGKKKAKDISEDNSVAPVAPKERSADNLVGKINNLVTTDLNNITDGRDFLLLGECLMRLTCRSYLYADGAGEVVYFPLQVALSVWFLYSILGWSAFVGLLVMVLLFPIPGYVAKMIQGVQETRMKKVCILLFYSEGFCLFNKRQTDARVQSVTESAFVRCQLNRFLSNPTSTVMNVLRMVKLFGWENKMKVKISEKRDEELVWLRKRLILDLINSNLKQVACIVDRFIIIHMFL